MSESYSQSPESKVPNEMWQRVKAIRTSRRHVLNCGSVLNLEMRQSIARVEKESAADGGVNNSHVQQISSEEQVLTAESARANVQRAQTMEEAA